MQKSQAMGFFTDQAPICSADLLSRAKQLSASANGNKPMRFALAGAESLTALQGAVAIRAAELGLVTLVGEKARILALSKEHQLSLGSMEILDCSSEAASGEATKLAREGNAQVVMKGSVKTDQFMRAILNREQGVRISGNRMLHIFYITPPDINEESAQEVGSGARRGILLSDCAVNVAPDEETKREALVLMARLARKLGFARPRIAVLSASEKEMESMPSSLVAGKIARWGQENLGDVADIEGPLSFDVALVPAAASIKNVGGAVAGAANGLLVSEIVAGNAIFKSLVWVGGGCAAGIVLGGMVPIVLTSRADKPAARLASAALALVATSEK